jgi:hypothetical protein
MKYKNQIQKLEQSLSLLNCVKINKHKIETMTLLKNDVILLRDGHINIYLGIRFMLFL